jgi:hypothetical protein
MMEQTTNDDGGHNNRVVEQPTGMEGRTKQCFTTVNLTTKIEEENQ